MKSSFDATLRFGQVVIPVGLVPAAPDGRSRFTTLHRECGSPIKRPAYCPVHERVVAADETVLGVEIAKGQFVTVEEAELAAVAPEQTHAIEIECLIDADRLDPARIVKTYYLSAAESPIGCEPYVFLHAVLVKQKWVALAKPVVRGGEWVAAIAPHPGRGVLLLQRLAFADEFVDPLEIETSLRGVEIREGVLELGCELGAKQWRTKPPPPVFQSAHQERVRELVDVKLAGGTLVEAPRGDSEPEAPTLPTVDLEEQLRASLRRGRSRQQPKSRAASGPRKG